jgi:polysaccharide biosynthesis protein PslJ
MVAALRRPALPKSAVLLIAAVGLLMADVVAHGGGKIPAAVVLAIVVAMVAAHVASRWSWLISGLVIVDLLTPSDRRYTLAGMNAFQLEPYRVFVALLLVGWVVSLLCDRRIKLRRTGFEGPLGLILFAIVGSMLLNPSRVSGTMSFVIKSFSLEASFLLVIYAVVSVVRTRAVLHWLIKVLVTAGAIEGLAAVIERKKHFNIFNHERLLLPIFHFNEQVLGSLSRGGALRAQASSGQPIELSAVMALLLPFAVYLAATTRQRRWYVAALFLLAGNFAGGSRTGMIASLVILIVFLWLRPRQTLKCWPALIPVFIVIHFLAPGAIGALYGSFFPQGGLLASEQEGQVVGPGGVVENTSRLSRWGPELHAFQSYNPLVGEGFGTRVNGRTSLTEAETAATSGGWGNYSFNGQQSPYSASKDNAEILDDQWLGTLLETGVLGLMGWLWLFLRTVRRLAARAKLERDVPEGFLPVALAASVAGFAVSMWFYDAFTFTQGNFLMHLLIAFSAVLLLQPVATRAAAGRGAGQVAVKS